MNEDKMKTAVTPAEDGEIGYKRPPVKSRFTKGKSGNPRGRKKGQRNMETVLKEVLNQTVTVKSGDRSERLTKGEALIKVIMNKANKGDRQAIGAISNLADKIGRIEVPNSETSQVGGVMLVPGVATSTEEWKQAVARSHRERDERDRRLKEDAPILRKHVADHLKFIEENQGTQIGDFAVSQLAKLKKSARYRSNYFLHWNLIEEEVVVEPPKPEPPKLLPWDPDEYVRLPFYARDEYARTHSEEERELQDRQRASNMERKALNWRNLIMRYKGGPLGDAASAKFKVLTSSREYLRNPYITNQRYPSEQEGEAYRRNLARLWEAERAVRDAENQGLEQQRIAAKALEDAEKEFKQPYQPET